MKFYLSSYKLGNKPERLVELFNDNKRVGYIPNAVDLWESKKPQKRKDMEQKQLSDLQSLGLEPEILDLREYFGKKELLEQKLQTLGGLWINGGNTFVLRQAMALSGMDDLLIGLLETNFVYAGFSAAGCVAGPTLKTLQIVDEPVIAYENIQDIIWEGLGFTTEVFMPHYDSDHPESEDISKEIALCKQKNIPYKPLRDGDVWIFEKKEIQPKNLLRPSWRSASLPKLASIRTFVNIRSCCK